MKKYKSNMLFMLKNWWTWDKAGYIDVFLKIAASVLMPIFLALIFKFFFSCLSSSSFNLKEFILLIVSLLLTAVFFIVNKCSDENLTLSADIVKSHYRMDFFNKLVSLKISFTEREENSPVIEKALEFSRAGRNASCAHFCKNFTALFSTLLGAVTYLSIVVAADPVLVLAIVITSVIDVFLNIFFQKVNKKAFEASIPLWNKVDYYFEKVNQNVFAREIRAFTFAENIRKRLAEYNAKLSEIMKKFMRKCGVINAFGALSFLLRNVFIYSFLVYRLKTGLVEQSDFVFLITLITGFSSWLIDIISQFNNMAIILYSCSYYMKFVSPEFGMKSNKNSKKVKIESIESIEFSNVSFAYEDKNVIDNMNFRINKGEHVALVGINGAGKSTVIKLICGFYMPDKGKVLINGINTNEIDLVSLRECISPAFQDYFFYPATIEENIALEMSPQTVNITEAARKNGMDKFTDADFLKKKVNTDGISKTSSLSGGEAQKLLFLRMLMHSGNLLLLDEPTAALDAISENRFYTSVDKLCCGKTAIFISHRLVSTEFCDKILLIEHGRVIEEGSKEELIKKDGSYSKMYKAQSFYYKFDWVKNEND